MSELFLSYAPNAEDVVVWRALGGIADGRYLDVHLALGETGLGTRGLYEQAWRGVHLVAQPDQAEALRIARPGDLVATVVEGRPLDALLEEAGIDAGGVHLHHIAA